MRDTQLLVIGDSHTNFWNGTGNPEGYDTLPGIRSHTIHGALAYSLLKENSLTNARNLTLGSVYAAVAEGFSGWILLNFGANDCNGWIWRQVPRLRLETAIRGVVERYAAFIAEVREIYPKVAIFGPPACTKSPLFLGDVGTEPERNLAILVYTSMLKERLEPLGIPVMSMARAMMSPDGRARGELFWDCNHASQAMMPYALKLVNDTLGLNLVLHDDLLRMQEYRVRTFEGIDYCEQFDRRWLRFVIPEGAQYISDIAIWPKTFAELACVDIVTSLDRRSYELTSFNFVDGFEAPTQLRYLPVNRHARNILVASPIRDILEEELEVYKVGSHISQLAAYSSESLFALHDRIMQQTLVSVIAEETVPLLEIASH